MTGQLPTAENGWINTIEQNNPAAIALAKHLITEQIYCTLSTCTADGMPWGSPLLFVYDQDFKLYWSSAIAAQHSQNLYHNHGRATITLYDASQIKAVYLRGLANELTDTQQLATILQLFDQRAQRPTARQCPDYLAPSPRRMYQFTPHDLWLTGDRLTVQDQLIDTKIHLNHPKM